MKHLLLTAGLAVVGLAAQAQVTLEQRYADLQVTRFSNGDLKYVVDNEAAGTVAIYNENHSLLRQLTVPAGTGGYAYTYSALVSDKLFNTDNAIEYIAFYNRSLPNGDNIGQALILSESGTRLLTIDSVSTADYVVRGTSGLKLLAGIRRYDAAGNSVGSYEAVYALGGTSSPLVNRAASTAADAQPYPNPTHERITLPYSVPAGQTATLDVLDLTGRVVKTYTVGAAFDHLLLDARELRAGAYTYRLRRADGSLAAGKRFVVQ